MYWPTTASWDRPRRYATHSNRIKIRLNIGIVFQLTIVGSYLDAHFLYSHSMAECKTLRTFSDGKFNLNKKNVLIEDGDTYQAGDFRVPQTPWLSLLHSIFYRIHNLFAGKIAEIHPDWKDERVFQETRRIIIAIYQHLIYDEWIPLILGL